MSKIMTPETLNIHEGNLEERPAPTGLVNVVAGMPRRQRAALVPRVIKEIVAGRISSAEASEIARAMKR
jgi:hypothetical protein